MNPGVWKRVTEVFNQVLAVDASRRQAYLDEVRQNEPEVGKEVDSLIHSYLDSEDFLETPAVSANNVKTALGRGHDVFSAGDMTGDFEIVQALGAGAFATVYLAHQKSLDRRVALKVSACFSEEARTMAHLEHDHIVKIYSESVDSDRDVRLICMQYVPGATLERTLARAEASNARLRSGADLLEVIDSLSAPESTFNPAALKDREALARLNLPEAILWMGLRLADALSYAHQRGVLHLDVKPGNILISPYGRPMLSDFNISINRQAREENRPRVFGGTANYMAPEHHKIFQEPGGADFASRIDHRADIYSLGVVLREFFAKTAALSPGADGTNEIERILRRCTAADPNARYASASEVAKALEGCLELFQVGRAMPPLGGMLRFTDRHAFAAMTFFILLPNVLGSVVNIAYNRIRIVSHLTALQQWHFQHLVVAYNCLVYPACILYVLRELLFLRPCLKKAGTLCEVSPERIDELRGRALRLPLLVATVITIGWLPGSVYFPLGLEILAGPAAPPVFLHFAISITLSWLIALTYAYLYTELVVLRLLYPRLWVGKNEIRRTARQELTIFGPCLRALHFMAGFVPLAGAALIVLVGPDTLDAASYQTYRWLVAFLIGLGMLGLMSALKASGFIAQTLFALSGTDQADPALQKE